MGYGNPDIEEIRTRDLEIELQRRKLPWKRIVPLLW
jgi:hypothetical protein